MTEGDEGWQELLVLLRLRWGWEWKDSCEELGLGWQELHKVGKDKMFHLPFYEVSFSGRITHQLVTIILLLQPLEECLWHFNVIKHKHYLLTIRLDLLTEWISPLPDQLAPATSHIMLTEQPLQSLKYNFPMNLQLLSLFFSFFFL